MNDNNRSRPSASQERREYFRVNHDLLFEFKPVDAFSAENSDPRELLSPGGGMALIDELRNIDREAQQILKFIADKDRLLADYLQRLNSKVDLIARHSVFPEQNENQATSRINLSEEGIAFTCDRALYKGNFIAIRVTFLPSYIAVVVFAKVVRCDSKNNEYEVAARFHRLLAKDRQELSRQLMKAQIAHKKNQSTEGE